MGLIWVLAVAYTHLDVYKRQIEDLDDIRVLQLKEFQKLGSVPNIVKVFGGKEQFLKTAQALENELYRMAA